MTVISETGYGAVIRPIMSTVKTQSDPIPTEEELVENGAVRIDRALPNTDIQGRRVKQVFKVVQCVGTYPAMTITPLTVQRPIIQDIEETTPTPTPTPETNVPDTTTTSQTDTSSTTTTGTTTTPSQQTTGQSDTPSSGGGSDSMGSEGSGGGYGY